MAFTPVAGKLGAITINSQTCFLDAWRPSINSDMLDVSHFSMTPDADTNYWREFIAGLCGGSFEVEGDWDNQAAAQFLTGAAVKIRPGVAGTGTIGYTSTCQFSFSFKVEAIGGGEQVAGKGRFSGTLRITGVLTYPSNP